MTLTYNFETIPPKNKGNNFKFLKRCIRKILYYLHIK